MAMQLNNLSTKKWGFALTILLFLVVVIYIAQFISNNQSPTEETNEINSTISILGSDNIVGYESINFEKGFSEDVITDTSSGVSLDDFLKQKGLSSVKSYPEDISVNPTDNQVEELKIFGNLVGEPIKRYANSDKADLVIFTKLIDESEEQGSREGVTNIANRYMEVFNELSKIEAHKSMVDMHENLTSEYKNMSNAFRILASSDLTIDDYNSYNKVADDFSEVYILVALFFRANGVIFEDSEPGSVFTLSL